MFQHKLLKGLVAALALLAVLFPFVPTHALAAQSAQATDPAAIVKAYYDAYNAGDIDKAVSYLAEDVTFVNPTGTFVGKAKARENLQAIKKDGLTFELSNFKDVNGRVTYSYKVVIGGTAVETGDGGLTIVKNGLIVFDGTVDTEPQLPQTGMDPTVHALLWVATIGVILLAIGGVLLLRKSRKPN